MRGLIRVGSLVAFALVLSRAPVRAQDADPQLEETATPGANPESEPASEPDSEPESPEEARSPRMLEAMRRSAIAIERAENSDCGTAIAELEAVYEILEEEEDARYGVLFYMAGCYEELLRFDEALLTYERFLEEAPDRGEDLGHARRAIRRIEAMLATVVISSNVPAAVWIDAQEAGPVNGEARFRVTAGRHTIELRAAGYEQTQQEVSLASGITEELSFALTELSDFEGISPGWVWASGGLAVAAAVGGGIAGIIAISRSDIGDRPIHSGDVESVQTPALAADILFGVAGALAITTIVLAASADWDGDADDADVALTIRPTGISLQGAF